MRKYLPKTYLLVQTDSEPKCRCPTTSTQLTSWMVEAAGVETRLVADAKFARSLEIPRVHWRFLNHAKIITRTKQLVTRKNFFRNFQNQEKTPSEVFRNQGGGLRSRVPDTRWTDALKDRPDAHVRRGLVTAPATSWPPVRQSPRVNTADSTGGTSRAVTAGIHVMRGTSG